jgi:hypothetical protein
MFCGRRMHRLHRLHHLGGIGRVTAFADDLHRFGPWGRRRHGRRRAPSIVLLLIAGLAVYAFVRLTDASHQPRRTRGEKLLLAALLVVAGAVVLSLHRSRARDW